VADAFVVFVSYVFGEGNPALITNLISLHLHINERTFSGNVFLRESQVPRKNSG